MALIKKKTATVTFPGAAGTALPVHPPSIMPAPPHAHDAAASIPGCCSCSPRLIWSCCWAALPAGHLMRIRMTLLSLQPNDASTLQPSLHQCWYDHGAVVSTVHALLPCYSLAHSSSSHLHAVSIQSTRAGHGVQVSLLPVQLSSACNKGGLGLACNRRLSV